MLSIMFVTGASSIHSERWVSYFAERGHRVFWVALGEQASNVHENVQFIGIPKHSSRLVRPVAYMLALRKLIRRIKPDILHAHQVWIDGIIAAATGFQPLIITPWGSDVLLGSKSLLKRPLLSAALNRAALITCDGENTGAVLEDLGVARKKIETICFGVNVEHFKPNVSGHTIRGLLGLTDEPVIISLRSLTPLYDVDTLVRAARLVLDKIPKASFIIAGDGVELSALRTLAVDLGVDHAVKFVGRISESKLPSYFGAANVYVSTALSDSGLAASTAEAMACGLPVIVTDSGSNRDWIIDGENGYVIPLRNPSVLAQKIEEILGDQAKAIEWGDMNREIILTRNNYYLEMAEMEKLYVSISNNAREGKT